MAILRFVFTVLLLLCLTLSSSFGQDKDKKAEDKNAKADPKEKWIPAGQVVAVLKEVRESDKSVVLSIQTQNSYYSPQARRVVPAKMEDIELLLKDDVKIRQANPPEAFDDKGRPKKYSIKELKELKGDDLKTPSDFVICWTKDGKDTGGTGQAMRIATYYWIPVYNLFYPEDLKYEDDKFRFLITDLCNLLRFIMTLHSCNGN